MDYRNRPDDRPNRPGVPPKLGEKTPLPFFNKPASKPSTRVHTAKTTINGKTYETTTVETPYGSTTTTKEIKPKTAEQWRREEKATDIILLVFAIGCVLLFIFYLLRQAGLI